ncbi:MAG: SCO family protein [Bryobacteraceae bacterium]|nr:SCO family protein [Bryobacteraceae bacterium]
MFLFRRIVAAAAIILAAGCGRPPDLPSYNTVPPFTLTSQSGEEFHSEAELAGKIWIADFIFTSCTGPCPRMSAFMLRLQNEFRNLPDIRLVSFTVDPATDVPAVLAEYAKRFQAEPERWFFLTGPREELHKLSREVFMLGDIAGDLEHSTRFVLVDKQGVVRGYYMSALLDDMNKLIADARALARAS